MSIIYDALKKSGGNPEQNPKPAAPAKKPFNFKKLFLPVVCVILIIFAVRYFGGQKNQNRHYRHANHKHNTSSKAFNQPSGKNDTPYMPPQATVQKNYSSATFALEGIIYEEKKPLAIINGKVSRVGDTVNDMTIESITADKIILRDKNGAIKELTI